MFKTKQKLSSLIVACLTMFVAVLLAVSALIMHSNANVTASAAETTETISIAGSTGTLSSDSTTISWSGEHFTFTNIKGSTAIRTSDSTHYRAYASSTGAITANNNEIITQIVITCSSSSYTDECQAAFKSTSTATIDGSTVTIAPATGTTSVGYTSTAQWRLTQIVVTYEEASSEPACTHEGFDTTWVYASETNEHYQQCVNCEAEIEGTRAACSEFTYGEYTTVDGVHTRTATCTVCSGEQTDSGTCEVSAEYVREGDQHTQTGTCSICNASTSVTEDCTLSYKNVSNDNGTHNMTSTCSVCNQSVTTENVNCTFDGGDADGATVTYTCEYCDYSYSEEVTTYTVTYVVPDGITAIASVEVADGFTTVLPTADTVEGYTFVGWTTAALDEKTEAQPESFKADDEYEVTADVTFYALYSYTEGTGAFTLVTDASTLAVGKEIVIVASDSDYAMGADKGNNRNAVEITKSGDTVTIDDTVQIITLETGNVANTFAFNVGNGYLYAASSGSNYLKTRDTLDDNGSWLITIDSVGVATIKAQGTYTRNWLRKNSSSALFACYASGQNDVSIYMKNGATYYVTSFNTCEHNNTEEVIENATCTESGSRTVTCLDCESVIIAEILPALGHNFIDDICEHCGKQDPASIVYDGYYYLILNNKYLDATTLDGSDRYKPVDFTPSETVEYKYVFYFVNNGETYDMYEMVNGLYMENVTLVTSSDYTVKIYNEGGNIFSHNANANYVGFYKTTNNYANEFTFVEVDAPTAHIDSASITIGADLTLNYYVTMSDVFADATMYFEIENTTFDVKGEEVDGRYVFSLDKIAPQYMATNVKAELKFNDILLASMENYSIQTYAQNKLEAEDSSTELKQLVSDLLRYGEAAQNYKNYDIENLATAAVTGILDASEETPTTTDFKLTNATLPEGVDSYGAYFTGAGVRFDNVNKIYVDLSTTENVTLTINGEAVEVTGTRIYTEAIKATEFDKTYTFVLSHNGVEMQTLTYSVNAYAYAKNGDATMGELAIALYRYGISAKTYADV